MTSSKNKKIKRKEQKRIINDEKKREKEKALEKKQNEKRQVKKVRMLKDGSVGFGNKFKFSRVGIYTTAGIFIMLGLFIAGLNGAYDDYLPDVKSDRSMFIPMSFEECEAIDFNDSYCALDYKFCRTYEDGSTICQYAENDPFVNVDPNESRFTEEEQDFLPPGSVITDFIFGWFPPDAHAEDRNHFTIGIYKSNSCKAQTTTGFGDCPTYEMLVQNFDNTNQAMSGKFIWSDYDNDIYRAAPDFKSHYNFYQYADIPTIIAVDPDTQWFNCCMDAQIFIEPSNFVFYDNDLAIDTTIWEFDDEQKKIREEIRQRELEKEPEPVYTYSDEDDKDLDNDGIPDDRDDCIREKEDFNGFEDSDGCPDDEDGDGIKGTADLCPREQEDFNGYKDSDGCIDDLDFDGIVGNKCLTPEYREEYKRIHQYDEDPNTRNVPADCFIDIDECPLEPETHNRFEDEDGCPDLAERTGELVLQHNVYIEGCSFARVAANMTLITQTINYFWNNCEGEQPEIIEYRYVPSIPINYDDHIWYKYTEWINQKAQECLLKC